MTSIAAGAMASGIGIDGSDFTAFSEVDVRGRMILSLSTLGEVEDELEPDREAGYEPCNPRETRRD